MSCCRRIRVAHSPDADDAFMFYALACGKIDCGPYLFEHTLQEIQTLNRWAFEGRYEVTALSFHAYAYVADRYLLLPHGASMGERYGPRLVGRRPYRREELPQLRIGIPGELTTAALVLQLYAPGLVTQVWPFDQLLPAVAAGELEAGLLIHEGQLTYREAGLHLLVDLGCWWREQTGLPLPLGGNGIRRNLGRQDLRALSRLVRESIAYALDHREEALDYASAYGRGLSRAALEEFVGMYVNERTLRYGEEGRQAVRELLRRGHAAGRIPHRVEVEFVEEEGG